MATEAEEQDTNDVVIENEAEETTEAETQDEDTTPEAENISEPEAESPETDDSEVIVTIGDTPPPEESEEQKAPEWVKELRKSHRETQRENRELKKQLEAQQTTGTQQVTVGPKPKLDDFDYDTDKYEAKLAEWYEQKRKADAQKAEAEAEKENQQKAWQQKLDNYQEKKSKLKVRNFDDAEAAVQDAFNEVQQGIVIQGADDPALTFYALGNNEGKLKELAAITDPVKFSFAVAKLETQLKVKNRKAPPPEKTVTGTAPKSGAVDSELERLRDEASRTGDYSKVHQYKRQKKRQQAK